MHGAAISATTYQSGWAYTHVVLISQSHHDNEHVPIGLGLEQCCYLLLFVSLRWCITLDTPLVAYGQCGGVSPMSIRRPMFAAMDAGALASRVHCFVCQCRTYTECILQQISVFQCCSGIRHIHVNAIQ